MIWANIDQPEEPTRTGSAESQNDRCAKVVIRYQVMNHYQPQPVSTVDLAFMWRIDETCIKLSHLNPSKQAGFVLAIKSSSWFVSPFFCRPLKSSCQAKV